MTKEILFSDNLIEIEEALSKFKEHHQKKGAEMAHRLVKERLIDNKGDRAGRTDIVLGRF